MASHIYRLGGLLICSGLIVFLGLAMLLAAAFEEIGGQASSDALWIPLMILLAMVSICLGLLPPDARAGTQSAIGYLLGAVILSYGVSVAAGFVNPRVLAGVGLALIAPSFFPGVIDRRAGVSTIGGSVALLGLLGWDAVRGAFPPAALQEPSLAALAFALLAVVLGLTHRRAPDATRWSALLDWLYLTGLASLILWEARDSTVDPLGIGYAVWLSLLLVPLGVTLLGVLRQRGGAEGAERIYVAGGLCVCFALILWCGFAPSLGFGGGGLASVIAGTFWYPLTLVLAMGCVCFGFLSPEVRPGPKIAIGSVGGATILSLGAVATSLTAGYVDVWPSRLLTGVGLALIAPSFLVAIARSTSRNTGAYAVAGALFLTLAAQVRC